MYTNFADRSKTTQGLNSLMNSLYSEVYGDRLQCLHLLLSYHRANNKNHSVTIRQYDSLVQNFEPAVLEGESYNLLLSDLNTSFGVSIKKCYGDFVVIGSPIITRTETDVLVALCKSKMPYHYKTMYAMLGYNKKVGITKNKHLVETGYYDRQVFYSFLSMSRQRNPHKIMNWAIISACANYGRGCGDMVNRRSTYLGGSATTQSFLRHVKPHIETMLSTIAINLSGLLKTVWMLDNNQKGHPKKFQRYGSSNRFVKVTGRTSRKCILSHHICEEENSKRVTINYIDQMITNPLNFPIFEQELSLMDNTSKINDCLLRRNTFQGLAVQLDLTGKRVSIYNSLVCVSSTIKCVILPLLSGYVSTTDKYKRWKHQPDEYYSSLRMIVMKLIHGSQLHLREITKFQEKVVLQWNPLSKESTSLIIPPVSLRDEIKANGYGMAIIEILCLSGLLIHTTTESLVESWDLVNDWESRTVYLCMDGLSLDRHRSFQKKLVKLPYAYTKVFKQSIIFQKALSRVIDISGPLHIAFHMLQSIFIIYKDMMKWAQAVVNWEKINVNKVSESFDACRQLCMITLEEVERVAIDLFLIEHSAEIQRISGENVMDLTDTAAIVITKMYNEYINDMKSSDNRRLYMFGFIIMATQFRNYWMSTRLGDRITMEHIQNQWIGVHLLSGKHKCVENYLNAIELEYRNIDNISLQEVRMNISVRYHEGNDAKGNAYPLHPLDEVQENVNQWTKRILLGPEEASWKGHSPNVACAHMCINF